MSACFKGPLIFPFHPGSLLFFLQGSWCLSRAKHSKHFSCLLTSFMVEFFFTFQLYYEIKFSNVSIVCITFKLSNISILRLCLKICHVFLCISMTFFSYWLSETCFNIRYDVGTQSLFLQKPVTHDNTNINYSIVVFFLNQLVCSQEIWKYSRYFEKKIIWYKDVRRVKVAKRKKKGKEFCCQEAVGTSGLGTTRLCTQLSYTHTHTGVVLGTRTTGTLRPAP